MTDIRKCVDCKHCTWPAFATGDDNVVEAVAVCNHPRHETRVSYVVGPLPSMLAREFRQSGECGDAGHLWEQKS